MNKKRKMENEWIESNSKEKKTWRWKKTLILGEKNGENLETRFSNSKRTETLQSRGFTMGGGK